MEFSAELRMPTLGRRVPGLPIVFAGWGDPRTNFLWSGAVVFWGFGVRCGRVNLSLQALAVYGGRAKLTDAHPRGVPEPPIVLPGWGDPCTNFLGSGAVGWNLSVPALAVYGGSVPNYGCPPIRGSVPWLSIVWQGSSDVFLPIYKPLQFILTFEV